MEQNESYLPATYSDTSQTTIIELIDTIDRLPGPQQIDPLMRLLRFVWDRSAEAEALLLRRLIAHPYACSGLVGTQAFLYERLAYVLACRPDLCLSGVPWEGQECRNRALELTSNSGARQPEKKANPVWDFMVELAKLWLRLKVAKRALR